jgi:hypothetical protein
MDRIIQGLQRLSEIKPDALQKATRHTLMPSITALLPAYNEEVSIGSVVLRTRQFADRVLKLANHSEVVCL